MRDRSRSREHDQTYKSSLSPLAPIFIPKQHENYQHQSKPQNALLATCAKHRKETEIKVKAPISKKGPSKRTSFLLPGQSLLTKYLPLKIFEQSDIPSLSIPTQTSEETFVSVSTLNQEIKQPTLPSNKVPPTDQEPIRPISTQKTLFDFSYFKPYAFASADDPDVFGHVPQSIDTSKIFRILLQNPNGVRPSVTDPEFMFSLHLCNEVGVGAICLAETNLNWHYYQHTAALRRCLHRNWSSSKFQTSVPDEKFIGNYQPGGTTSIITDRWTSRIVQYGMDPFGLGRWSYVILRWKSETNICIITAYRVCNDKTTGPKTAYQQQKRQLSALLRQENGIINVDPFRQFVLDLHSWIASVQEDGTQIVLCLDNNEEISPNQGQLINMGSSTKPIIHQSHDGRLETLACSVGLIYIISYLHPSTTYPATYIRGRKRIDLILISASLLPAVKRSGILPYNSMFQGDHRPCYIDLDADEAFGGKTAPISPPCQCSLQLHDPRIVTAYVT
jgi:hypothetical protein